MPLYTVLPSATDPEGTSTTAILKHVIAESLNVVLVIVGRPTGVERILEVALGRAEAMPNVRRVVHVTKPDLLDGDVLAEITNGERRNVAAVFGVDDRVVVRLTATQAADRFEVEDAFYAGMERQDEVEA